MDVAVDMDKPKVIEIIIRTLGGIPRS